ncbi:MAG: methyl-accepting chemotaxis protein [bacterium]
MTGTSTLKTAAPRVASAARPATNPSRAGASRLALLALVLVGVQGTLTFLVLEGMLTKEMLLPLATTTGSVALIAALSGWLIGGRLWGSFAAGLRDIPAALRQTQHGNFDLRLPAEEIGSVGDTCRAINRILDGWALMHSHLEEERAAAAAAEESLIETLSLHQAGDRSVRCRLAKRFAELSGTINTILDETAEVESRLESLSSGIGNSAEEIRAAADETKGDAAQQREACGTTGAGAETLRRENQLLTELCEKAIASSRNAEMAGQSGQSALADLIAGMEGLQRETRAATVKIKRLGERSMQVAAITETISKMSAQTDMLALNAAIEASLAGEQGHGFTVVAEEVRKLAERASQAAREVERLISGIQSDVGEAVGGMERQGERIELHSAAAGDAQRAVEKVLASARTATAAVDGVAKSAGAQCEVADQLGSAMTEIGDAALRLERSGETTRNRTEALLQLCGTVGSKPEEARSA